MIINQLLDRLYPPVKKRWVKVEVDNEERYMFMSETMYQQIINIQRETPDSKKS